MMNMLKEKLLLCLTLSALVLGVSSCDQDPYPIDPNVNGRLQVEPLPDPDDPEPTLPDLSMSVDDIIEYKEGRLLEYKIRVAVKEPGEAIVKIDNLPAGATFDPETYILNWRPSYFDGNDPNDPSIKSQIYPITVWLRSSEDEVRALRRKVNLVVYDIPQRINVTADTRSSAYEGKKFESTFTIDNVDYPQGPFKVTSKGLPANSEIVEVDPNTYKIVFNPDHFHVNRKNDGRSLTYDAKIIVHNPANHIEEIDYRLTVNDERLPTELVAPEQMTQGLDLSFQVSAFDLNKEVTPELELLSNHPKFGKFRFEKVESKENFSTVLNVFWEDIPPSKNGEVVELEFKACVLDSRASYSQCENKKTKIELVVRDRKAPFIGRSEWPIGELIYLGFEDVLERRVVIRDQEDPSLSPKVEIFPEQMRKYVRWSRNKLVAQFDKKGVYQFSLKATSDYNMSSAESFIVEVFPKERHKTLMLADSTRDPEVLFYKERFKTMDIMNPAIQEVNLRNVSNRDTLVITTSSLFDKSNNDVIMKAIEEIENVVVATPRINNLPEAFLKRLSNEYDFKPIGRYLDIPNMPDFENLQIETTSQFDTSVNPIELKGKASVESTNPMIFNGGLDDPNKNCKSVIGISSGGEQPFVLGLSCKRTLRTGGGRISILGTEWADLKVSEEDIDIPMKWFNTMLRGNF